MLRTIHVDRAPTYADWSALPEIECPVLADEADVGNTLLLSRAGFMLVPRRSVPMPPPSCAWNLFGSKVLLPTCTVVGAHYRHDARSSHRLPLQYCEWTARLTAFSHAAGRSPFDPPCHVEFGILKGRYYAEIEGLDGE